MYIYTYIYIYEPPSDTQRLGPETDAGTSLGSRLGFSGGKAPREGWRRCVKGFFPLVFPGVSMKKTWMWIYVWVNYNISLT